MKQIININNTNGLNKPKLNSNILYSYLRGLSDENIKNISNTITNNFILYKNKMINKKIKSIFTIYFRKELLFMKEKLLKWQQNIEYNISINQSKIDFENSQINNYFHLNLNEGIIADNFLGVKKITNNYSKANDSQINFSSISNSNMNISQINYENDFQIKNNLNKNKNNKFTNLFSTINNETSNILNNQIRKQRPHSSEIPERIKNYFPIESKREKSVYLKIKKNKIESEKIFNKFIKRQEHYIKNNSKKKNKIIKDSEEENLLIYTFEPKVNESLRKLYKNENISASRRLYNDSIKRKNKKSEKQININNNNKINARKSFNKNIYNELYEDSKKRKGKKDELIRKIEKECGYTYAPTILHRTKKIKKNHENNPHFLNSNTSRENNKIKNFKKLGKNSSYSKLVTLNNKVIKKKEEKNC